MRHHHHDDAGPFLFWHDHTDDEVLTDPKPLYAPVSPPHDHRTDPPCFCGGN